MSEPNIPEVTFTLEVAETVQAPIDDTLEIEGMAADAKATGDAIAQAKTDLQAEIDAIPTVEDIADLLYPVGSIYVSTSDTQPEFGGTSWRWQEILIPVTYGDLITGTRSYTDLDDETTGTVHFWLRLDNAEV